VIEEWEPIPEFDNYSVSSFGHVMNLKTGLDLSVSLNAEGVPKVSLYRDGRVYSRSVNLLVANAFISQYSVYFNSVINLDGDRLNNHVDNLARRPRWFAVSYNKQFKPGYQIDYRKPLRDKATGIEYPNSFVVSTTFGVLDKELFLATMNRTYVFPTNQMFEFV
jgi:hypothetical protein